MKAIITNESKEQEALNDFLNEEIDNKIYLKDIHIASGEILQALVDKSIPMKIYRQDEDGVLGECPCCSDRIDMSCRHYQKESPNHCPNCGQKLDWSDSNE
jgi:hypothetical protein